MTAPQKPKKKINGLLLQVLIISALVHLAFLIGFGSYTVYKHVARADTQFEEPPTVVEAPPPPPKDVEVVIQRTQRVPDRSSAMRSLQVQQVGNIAVAAVTANVPTMQEGFTVSGGTGAVGMGGGGGGRLNIGSVSGGIGLGMSELNVFGIQDKGERILFMVNTGRDMLTDNKGGLHSYNAIKEELARLIGNLAPGALYNVILFEEKGGNTGGAIFDAFQPSLVSATPANLERLKKWLDPVNRDVRNLGVKRPNLKLSKGTDDGIGAILSGNVGASRVHRNSHYAVTQAALEQNVDLIFVITNWWRGITDMTRPYTPEENAAWQQTVASPAYQEKLAAFDAERKQLVAKADEMQKKLNEQRKRQGLPPRVFINNGERFRTFGLSPKLSHPGYQPPKFYPARQVQKYFEDFLQEHYRKSGQAVPRMNFIIFMAADGTLEVEQRDGLRTFTRMLGGGRFRELKGLSAIKSHFEAEGRSLSDAPADNKGVKEETKKDDEGDGE